MDYILEEKDTLIKMVQKYARILFVGFIFSTILLFLIYAVGEFIFYLGSISDVAECIINCVCIGLLIFVILFFCCAAFLSLKSNGIYRYLPLNENDIKVNNLYLIYDYLLCLNSLFVKYKKDSLEYDVKNEIVDFCSSYYDLDEVTTEILRKNLSKIVLLSINKETIEKVLQAYKLRYEADMIISDLEMFCLENR